MSVSTGNGVPYNGNFIFSLATRGNDGTNGTNGSDGSNGTNGTNGSDGNNGHDGSNGNNGHDGSNGNNGHDGSNGQGRHVLVTKLLPGQGGCAAGGTELDFYTIVDGVISTTPYDTKVLCHGNNGTNGNNGSNGVDGKAGAPGLQGNQGFNGPQGPQGPPGVAKGWHKKFDTSAITSTSSNILSQVVTGTPAYLIDAKVNSPFANNAKSVACTLTVLDNGVTTTIDSSDALLIGNTQVTAKGGISLAGVYNASSSSANVTIGVSCGTGGDTRTLTNGRINIVGANSITQ